MEGRVVGSADDWSAHVGRRHPAGFRPASKGHRLGVGARANPSRLSQISASYVRQLLRFADVPHRRSGRWPHLPRVRAPAMLEQHEAVAHTGGRARSRSARRHPVIRPSSPHRLLRSCGRVGLRMPGLASRDRRHEGHAGHAATLREGASSITLGSPGNPAARRGRGSGRPALRAYVQVHGRGADERGDEDVVRVVKLRSPAATWPTPRRGSPGERLRSLTSQTIVTRKISFSG